jgi:hypothetical protein
VRDCTLHAHGREAHLKVVGGQRDGEAALTHPRAAPRSLVLVGLALLAVTAANLALVWAEVEFGTARWELAAATQTFERVPMLLVSLLMIGLGGIAGASIAAVRAAAVGFWAVALVVLVLDVIYAVSALQAYAALPQLVQRSFRLSAVKNVIASALFVLVGAYGGWLYWGRRVRPPAAS